MFHQGGQNNKPRRVLHGLATTSFPDLFLGNEAEHSITSSYFTSQLTSQFKKVYASEIHRNSMIARRGSIVTNGVQVQN